MPVKNTSVLYEAHPNDRYLLFIKHLSIPEPKPTTKHLRESKINRAIHQPENGIQKFVVKERLLSYAGGNAYLQHC